MYTCFLWKNCCVRQRKKWEHDCPKQVLKCANKSGTISQNGAIKVIWYNMSRIWKSSHHVSHITDLVLGSRSVGFTSATFFSQSKMSQSSLNWDILNTVQGQQCHIVLPKIAQNCSTWPKLARQKCLKLLEVTQAGPKKLLRRECDQTPGALLEHCWQIYILFPHLQAQTFSHVHWNIPFQPLFLTFSDKSGIK